MKDIKEFGKGFLKAMNNELAGHSLKKWLAVGIFWLIVESVLRFGTSTNLEGVLVILSGLILTLMGLNVADKKVNNAASMPSKEDKKEDIDNPTI